MASKIVETVERDGVKIHVYESGLERNAETGRIVKPADGTVITPERATLLHRRRQEKTAALLRQRIVETHNGIMPTQVTTSAAAFAEAGAMLHEQIVLNSEAYPRDRMEAWEKLGKYSGVLPADIKQQTDQVPPSAVPDMVRGIADAMARVIADIMQAQTIQPSQVIDIRTDNESE